MNLEYDSFFSAVWIFLVNSAVTDIIFSFATTFLQCRIIAVRWAFAYATIGPARFFGEQISYYTYVLQLHTLFYTFLCFPLSFGYRYYILVRPKPSIKQVCLVLLCVWLLALAQSVCFINSQSDSASIIEYMAEVKPEYNLSQYVISGNHMLWNPLTAITLLSIVLPMGPIYVIVIVLYKRINVFLEERKQSGSGFHPSTVRGHEKLLKALTIQASLPLFFVFPPISIYILYHLEIIKFTIIEYLVYALFSFMPVANPILSIYFVKPYSQALRQLASKVMLPRTTSNGMKAMKIVAISTAYQDDRSIGYNSSAVI